MLSGVSSTAILTLRARAEEHTREDRVFEDPLGADWWARSEWPAELDAWYGPDVQMALALRADDIDRIAARYAELERPRSIVELGAGLSTRRHRLPGLSSLAWTDVDLPEVVALREAWGVGGAEHRQVACSVLDRRWMDALEPDSGPHLFIAEGLFYYLPRAEVDALLTDLRMRFPGSAIIFDVVGATDYAKLHENTARVGSPIEWKLETHFESALSDFSLREVPEFEPRRLAFDAVDRYWQRFDPKTRGMIYLAMGSPLFMAGRSGTLLGGL